MPHSENETALETGEGSSFPPVTRDHILHCSYDDWFPRYRAACIRSRIIPLTADFVSYLREDGIILADEQDGAAQDDDDWEPSGPSSQFCPPPDVPHSLADQGADSDSEPEDDEPAPKPPPNKRFPDLHKVIEDAILQLGGAVAPKLNWSSPKDAAWISRHVNTVKCTCTNDVYMLLKSSSFVSHDLEHAFDETIAAPAAGSTADAPAPSFTPVLVLRAFFSPMPSLEFRCFVKDHTLIAISARDLNYYQFLQSLRGAIVTKVQELFDSRLRETFPDPCYAFDVYIPEADWDDNDESKLGRARLIDINPWAPRTDSLLFDWSELLQLTVAELDSSRGGDADLETSADDVEYVPELRIVEKDDPAAYNFSSTQYSAHKLPKEVVDASMASEGGMREFARRWQQMTGGSLGLWETN